LIARLKGEKATSDLRGTGLEYTYLDVKEEDSEGLPFFQISHIVLLVSVSTCLLLVEIVTRIGVYSLDGSPTTAKLLSNVIPKDKIATTIVCCEI
jgi:hypothetical protein